MLDLTRPRSHMVARSEAAMRSRRARRTAGTLRTRFRPEMGSRQVRVGEVASRFASGFWLLVALLLLSPGLPSPGSVDLRLSGSGSVVANVARSERAKPRSAQRGDQAHSLAEVRQTTQKAEVSGGADQGSILIHGPGLLPGMTAAPRSPALDDRHLPAIASRAFDARAPPGRA